MGQIVSNALAQLKISPIFAHSSWSWDKEGLSVDDFRRDGHTSTPCAFFTRVLLDAYARVRARTRDYTWHIRAHIARATAAERGQRVASPVNNAGRGNGAISAHLLLNVRFAVLPPRPVPPRAHRAPSPRSPLPTPSYSSRATHLYPALNLHPGTTGLLPPWLLSSWRTRDKGGGWPTVRSVPYLIVPRSEFRRDRQHSSRGPWRALIYSRPAALSLLLFVLKIGSLSNKSIVNARLIVAIKTDLDE